MIETKNSYDEIAENLFFIVGCGRSGTTLLQAILSYETEITIPPETHFLKHIYLRRNEFGDIKEENGLNRFLQYLFQTRCFRDLELSPQLIEEKIRQSDRSMRSIFLLMLNEYAKKKGKRRIGEKTPSHIHYLPEIRKLFPKIKIINIVRDPRDVVNSLLKVFWASTSIYGNVKRWQECIQLHFKYSRILKKEEYINVRYEDLIENTEYEMRRICNFLRINYSKKMLEFYKRESRGFGDREKWKSNTFNPINKNSMGKGLQELSNYQLLLIEWMTKYEMDSLGYHPILKSSKEISAKVMTLFFLSYIKHFIYLCQSGFEVLSKAGPKALLKSRPGK